MYLGRGYAYNIGNLHGDIPTGMYSDALFYRLSSKTGRHLVIMPHIERSTFQWNSANYPDGRKDEASPWLEAFVNARLWLENK